MRRWNGTGGRSSRGTSTSAQTNARRVCPVNKATGSAQEQCLSARRSGGTGTSAPVRILLQDVAAEIASDYKLCKVWGSQGPSRRGLLSEIQEDEGRNDLLALKQNMIRRHWALPSSFVAEVVVCRPSVVNSEKNSAILSRAVSATPTIITMMMATPP